ncbi:MAG: hypothetical protein F6J95_016905 [Leptolyngbya sp. SIO1E4]|nr:hypothetical protein [Leptolyngbya sp. SIO1E4]
MAKRPVFIPTGKSKPLFDSEQIDFQWNPGFAPIQKKKNILALHKAAEAKHLFSLLEVSTKSEKPLGQRLSAFNLKIETEIGEISIEAAYQGSKVFEMGGPFTDIYRMDSRSAKRDLRLKESGNLIQFKFFERNWPLNPPNAFYDWLYISALQPHQGFIKNELFKYQGFTDIEFNPSKSINCQARACALLVSLLKLNSLDGALRSQKDFIEMISSGALKQKKIEEYTQGEIPFN